MYCSLSLSLALLALLGVVSASRSDDAGKAGPGVEKVPFGKTADGQEVDVYVLRNSKGAVAKVMTYGALLTELHVPDRTGKNADVVLGFDDFQSYLGGHPCFGATIGRVANRIAKGRFTLDGKEYRLAINNGPNSLHGGKKGYDKVVWKASIAKARPARPSAFSTTARTARKAIPETWMSASATRSRSRTSCASTTRPPRTRRRR